jgi:DNA repair exonuclease SbcCD ATPase subunit
MFDVPLKLNIFNLFKKKELEDIEGREKTLSENEANLLQRTENVEEREKIQADKDTLLAEINKLNEEKNGLKQYNDDMLETLNKNENSIRDLNKEVEDYKKLLKEKQHEFERSIAELEKQQLVEAKLEFEVLLNKVDVLKEEYEKNKETKSIYKSVGSFFVDVDNGWNAYFESIGTLIDVSKENKYFKYLTNNIGLNSEEDLKNITRYNKYRDIHDNEKSNLSQPLPQPPFKNKLNQINSDNVEMTKVDHSATMLPPPNAMEETYADIQYFNGLIQQKKLKENQKPILLQQCILYLDLFEKNQG